MTSNRESKSPEWLNVSRPLIHSPSPVPRDAVSTSEQRDIRLDGSPYAYYMADIPPNWMGPGYSLNNSLGRTGDARIGDTHTAPNSVTHDGLNTGQWDNSITKEKSGHQLPGAEHPGHVRSLNMEDDMEDDMPQRDPADDFTDEPYGYHSTEHSLRRSKNSNDRKRGGRQRGSHLTRDGAINARAVRKEGACLRCVFQKEKVWRAMSLRSSRLTNARSVLADMFAKSARKS